MIPKKNEKVTKSAPKTDHREGGEIDKATSFAAELVVWWRQLAQMCDLVDPRCEKTAQRASKKLKKLAQNEKHMQNSGRRVPKTDPALNTGAQDYARQQKYTAERHKRAVGSPKTKGRCKTKAREETTSDDQC